MSHLKVFLDKQPDTAQLSTADATLIQQHLEAVGVSFEQWQASQAIVDDMSEADIKQAYQQDITRVQAGGGYQTVDVISLAKGNPNAAQLREKFLFEHTHSEDEVRFFVKGQGLFCLHIADKVYQVLCQQGDLISVPANTAHWFDMGSDPEFTAIRFFNNEAGWIAQSTESNIAKHFPTLD
ncbi:MULTISPECIES: 1,2-dihydroxy-3-keto-5-methylthiopentene dioxygenase [Pseudoalteromonas]|uniref:Acireductone dioxygenase n=1 Tax=Pseudoalteromonas amylolytica TaxID=1859457 RepID=A0A1S1MWF6_9GAMM|nr:MULTISPECIES: cupin domain-containing protein [Pseudoalteromonas]OHU91796.1 acireductone dioxygenase [Pseudoalteromonas sp. JW3]OHU93122.1 acireductone dioxygenase [Pseudoalteromonas amylolytica]